MRALRKDPWTAFAPHLSSVNQGEKRGLIVGVRFMYGIRTVGPIVIGMSHVLARRFLIFNLIGAAIWSVTVAGGGFLFGQSLRLMLERIEGYEGLGALLIVGLAALLGGVRYGFCCDSRSRPS